MTNTRCMSTYTGGNVIRAKRCESGTLLGFLTDMLPKEMLKLRSAYFCFLQINSVKNTTSFQWPNSNEYLGSRRSDWGGGGQRHILPLEMKRRGRNCPFAPPHIYYSSFITVTMPTSVWTAPRKVSLKVSFTISS